MRHPFLSILGLEDHPKLVNFLRHIIYLNHYIYFSSSFMVQWLKRPTVGTLLLAGSIPALAQQLVFAVFKNFLLIVRSSFYSFDFT